MSDLEGYFVLLLAVLPATLASAGLRAHAKKHGRTYPLFRPAPNRQTPFVDDRLNEAYFAVRRYSQIGAFSIIGIAIVGGLILTSSAFFYAAIAVAVQIGMLRSLSLEFGIAFGAALNPGPPPAVEFRAPGTA